MSGIEERLIEPDYWISGSGGDDRLDGTPFEAAREIKRLREVLKWYEEGVQIMSEILLVIFIGLTSLFLYSVFVK